MSTVKTINLQHPSSASNNLVLDSSGNVTGAGTLAMASSFLRNRIINGDMRIDQRNAGASVTVSSGGTAYPVDRTYVGQSTDGVITTQRSTVAPAGFSNSLVVTATTGDAALASTQYVLVRQIIEGFNVSDLAWGTSSAVTVTLSFWVRASTTGTFSGSLANSAQNRAYPFTYTINSANTFEYKTITIPGDTTGTWLTDNGIGIIVNFGVGLGSSLLGTAGAWAASSAIGATGQLNGVSSNGATFYLTGVQLEPGSVATPFERRQYGQELALCQRYYYQSLPAWRGVVTTASTAGRIGGSHPVEMRSSPTLSFSANLPVYDGAATSTIALTANYSTTLYAEFDGSGASSLTAYRPAIIYQTGTAVARLSAEL